MYTNNVANLEDAPPSKDDMACKILRAYHQETFRSHAKHDWSVLGAHALHGSNICHVALLDNAALCVFKRPVQASQGKSHGSALHSSNAHHGAWHGQG